MSEPLPPADADFQELAAFTPESVETGDEFTTQDDTRTGHAKRPQAYLYALEMQRVLTARILDPDCPDSDKSRLVLAWDKLEDRKRILRGRPLPGSLSHTSGSSKRSVAPPLSIIDLTHDEAKSA